MSISETPRATRRPERSDQNRLRRQDVLRFSKPKTLVGWLLLSILAYGGICLLGYLALRAVLL
jgi:hypothetical protein